MKSRKNVDGYERLKIGNNIRKWRGIKGIKQKDSAASMKLSEAAISNFENDLSDITLSQMA
jgi:transcriptional regulator with XRE-family HTH domain